MTTFAPLESLSDFEKDNLEWFFPDFNVNDHTLECKDSVFAKLDNHDNGSNLNHTDNEWLL